MRIILVAIVTLVVGTAAHAQDKDLVDALQKLDVKVFKLDSPDAKLRWDSVKQMRDDVNKKDVEAWRKIKTKADWETYRDQKLALLRKSLGTFPEAPKEVKVVTTKTQKGEGFTVENIIYESRPNFYVTANLYAPEKSDKPMPGFIIVHSHHNPKTQGELQDMGILWAKQGCLVLVPDMLGHGERRQHPFANAASFPEKFAVSRQDYWFRYNTAMQLHLAGESLVGWMVWDLMCGVNVLHQRPNIDKDKIIALGSVAGGGDPCAVFAALDKRVAAAAPFNFGGPQPETKFPLPDDADLAFNYMGGASWESTRNLRWSGRDGFLPWLIVGSIAPRGLIYGHEFAWDQDRDPVWKRFNTIWGDFYGAKDKLAFAKGRGSVRGSAPESTHCNNIGFEHRKPMYPTLKQWFGLPIPEENKKRFDSSELQCWTDEARKDLKPKMLREVLRELKFKAPSPVRGAAGGGSELRTALGVGDLSGSGPSKTEWLTETKLPGNHLVATGVLRHEKSPRAAVPIVTIRPAGAKGKIPVVVALAQEGKSGFLKQRAETIAKLLEAGVAVCLPDLRGTGETANDGRGRTSGATSYSASLQMHGHTVPGAQLQELLVVVRDLNAQGYSNFALWGDSFVEPNDPKTNFAIPLDGKLPRQAEPMGGTLALIGGIFLDDSRVKAIYVRGGMVSFRSMHESPFCYFPHDAVIPDVLRAGDLDAVAEANAHRGLRLEALVDGLNRRVDEKTLKATYKNAMFSRPAHDLMVLREEPSSPAEVAAWLSARLKK